MEYKRNLMTPPKNTSPSDTLPLPEWLLAGNDGGGLPVVRSHEPLYLAHLRHPFLIARVVIMESLSRPGELQPRLFIHRLQAQAATTPEERAGMEQLVYRTLEEGTLYLIENMESDEPQTVEDLDGGPPQTIAAEPEVVWNYAHELPNLLAGYSAGPEAWVISHADPFLVATFDTTTHRIKQIVHLDNVTTPISAKLTKLITTTLTDFYRQAFQVK